MELNLLLVGFFFGIYEIQYMNSFKILKISLFLLPYLFNYLAKKKSNDFCKIKKKIKIK